jgi:hypothetical protein
MGANERQFAPAPLFITTAERLWGTVILPTSRVVVARVCHVEEEGGAAVQRSCHDAHNGKNSFGFRGESAIMGIILQTIT